MLAEPGAPNKCPGVFTMEALEAHERECPFTLMVCGFPGCNEEVMRSDPRGTRGGSNGKARAAAPQGLPGTKAELQETKAELQETKAEQRATKAELRDSKRKLERELASLKAIRMTQGAL